ICSDPEVMATLGPPLDIEATTARIDWMRGHEAEHGHCFWALERREDARLIGWCGVIRGETGHVADKIGISWGMGPRGGGRGFDGEADRCAGGGTLQQLT